MLIRDYYASLGVSYNTLSSYKTRFRFATIEETYQFYLAQKELKRQKKADLARIAKNLALTNALCACVCTVGVIIK